LKASDAPSRRAALALLALAVAAGPAGATVPAAPQLSQEDQRTVSEVIRYLEGLTNASGMFIQTTQRGGRASGAFYLQRPGRARFDYDPPSGVVIASDGRNVSVVDRRLKTIHVYPLGGSPLGLFLAKDIRLDRGVQVTRVIRNPGGVTVVARDVRKDNPGSIALDFDQTPLALTGWTITDARGGVVRVRLEGFRRSEPREAGFFVLSDPRRNAEPARPAL
jgi:outer membrane lipoprotein-sorting protein